MINKITENPHEFWFSLAGLLLIFEMLGTNTYMLWSGFSAAFVGFLVFFIPFDFVFQGILFSILTIIIAFLWWYLFAHSSEPLRTVNEKVKNMIGIQVKLMESTDNGYSRVKIADGSWRIYSDISLEEGTEVEVISVDGITLNVKPVNPVNKSI